MKTKWGLLRVLWHQALPATLVAGLAFAGYALLWSDVITRRNAWPAVIVVVHCMALGRLLGRFETPPFAFLYSRGCSRDALWRGLMLASAASVLAAWLCGTLVMWTGLRSLFHDVMMRSPLFPIMAPRETWVPLTWLGLYALLMPVCHYAWIRRAQPTKGATGGGMLGVGIIAALVVGFLLGRLQHGWYCWLTAGLCAVVAVTLILGGRQLHRSLEVRA